MKWEIIEGLRRLFENYLFSNITVEIMLHKFKFRMNI